MLFDHVLLLVRVGRKRLQCVKLSVRIGCVFCFLLIKKKKKKKKKKNDKREGNALPHGREAATWLTVQRNNALPHGREAATWLTVQRNNALPHGREAATWLLSPVYATWRNTQAIS